MSMASQAAARSGVAVLASGSHPDLDAFIHFITLVHESGLEAGSHLEKSNYKNNRHTITRVCLGAICHEGCPCNRLQTGRNSEGMLHLT